MISSKGTHYALHAVLELARAGTEAQVTVTQVAERYGIPASVLAKVFQRLVRAGIAVGTRGTRGGYTLARHPAQVTVLDVIEAFEPPRRTNECPIEERRDPECADFAICRLRRLFDEVDETSRSTYASVSFETLLGDKSRRVPAVRVAT